MGFEENPIVVVYYSKNAMVNSQQCLFKLK